MTMKLYLLAILIVAVPSCLCQSDEEASWSPNAGAAALGDLFSSAFSRLASEMTPGQSSQDTERIPQFYGVRKEDIPYCSPDFVPLPEQDVTTNYVKNRGPMAAALLASSGNNKMERETSLVDLFDGSHSFAEILFSLAGDSLRAHHKMDSGSEEHGDSKNGNGQRSVLVDVLMKYFVGSMGQKAQDLDKTLRHMNLRYRSLFCNLTHAVALSTNPKVAYELTSVLAGVLRQAESFRRLTKELMADFERTVDKMGDALQMLLVKSPGQNVHFLSQRSVTLLTEFVGRVRVKGFVFVQETVKQLGGLPKFGKVYVVEMVKIAALQVMKQFVGGPMPMGMRPMPQ